MCLPPHDFLLVRLFSFLQSLSVDDSSQPLSDQSDHSTVSSTTPTAHLKSEVGGHKFSVRYLGSHPVDENDLVPGQCVKVVHHSIRKTRAAGNMKVL